MPEIETPFGTIPEIPVCVCVPPPAEEVCIDFPVIGRVCSSRASFQFEGLDGLLMRFTGNLQPLLAPLMPILVLISIVIALIDCVKAIPKAISRLSPEPILDCIKRLVELFPQLASYIPPLNYLVLTQNVILFMITLLQALIDSLEALFNIDIDLELDLLPDNDNYRCCLDANIRAQLDQIAAALRMSGPLFQVVAELLKLLAFPGTEKYIQPLIDGAEFLAGVDSVDLDPGVIDILKDMQKALEAVHTVLGGIISGIQTVFDCECE